MQLKVISSVFVLSLISPLASAIAYKRYLESANSVISTRQTVLYKNFVWIIENYKYFLPGIELWSPELIIPDPENNIPIYFYFYIQNQRDVKLMMRHSSNSKRNNIMVRMRTSLLNATDESILKTASTTGFDDGNLLQISRNYDITWNKFCTVTELDQWYQNETNKDLHLLFEFWISLSYASNVRNDTTVNEVDGFRTYQEFGNKLFNERGAEGDLEVQLDDGSKENVHRSVLEFRTSGSFKKLIETASGSSGGQENRKININGVDKQTFGLILKYLYTYEVPKLVSMEELKRLLLASVKLDLKYLESFSLILINKSFTVNDALDWLNFAAVNNIEKLRDSTLKFIRENSIVIGEENWLSMLTDFKQMSCSVNGTLL